MTGNGERGRRGEGREGRGRGGRREGRGRKRRQRDWLLGISSYFKRGKGSRDQALKGKECQEQRYTPLIPPGRQKQTDFCDFQASLVYTVSSWIVRLM